MEKAIIVPVNPDIPFTGGAYNGRVLPHIAHIRKTGGVLWNCGGYIPKHHNEIKKGYFYETGKHAVTYQFEIIRFIDWSAFEERKRFIEQSISDQPEFEEAKFVPNFRCDDLIAIHDEFESGTRTTAFGILIKAINPLEKPIDPCDFKKVSDGRPIQSRAAVRANPIVYAVSTKVRKETMSLKELIHEHIRKMIDEGELTERDLEDMLEYMLYDRDCELVDRQLNLEKGRIDVAYRRGQTYYIIELKRKSADVNTLHQIKQYIKEVNEKHHPNKLEGMIICETATKALEAAVAQESRIKINEYKFCIDFGIRF